MSQLRSQPLFDIQMTLHPMQELGATPLGQRRIVPVSTPAGTVIIIFLRSRTSPAPPQVGHFSLGMLPLPRHIGQGR